MQNKRFWFSIWVTTQLTLAYSFGLPSETYKFLVGGIIIGFLGAQSFTDVKKILGGKQ